MTTAPRAAAGAFLLVLVAAAPARAAFPGSNGRIAFDYTGVVSLSPDGSGIRRLAGGYHPAHSPNGRMVAYGCGTDQDDRCPHRIGIRITRADGRGRPRRLTRNNGDDYPAWSPDGRSLVFNRYPGGDLTKAELWIYHRGHSRRLTRGENPAWSVRGEIAFHSFGFRVYVIRPDGSHLRRLAAGIDPQWSPHGQRLVYDGNPGVYTIRRDGRRRRLVASDGGQPDFSPDGRWVAFSAEEDSTIVVMRGNRSKRRTVFTAESPFLADYPDWQSVRRKRRPASCGSVAGIAC